MGPGGAVATGASRRLVHIEIPPELFDGDTRGFLQYLGLRGRHVMNNEWSIRARRCRPSCRRIRASRCEKPSAASATAFSGDLDSVCPFGRWNTTSSSPRWRLMKNPCCISARAAIARSAAGIKISATAGYMPSRARRAAFCAIFSVYRSSKLLPDRRSAMVSSRRTHPASCLAGRTYRSRAWRCSARWSPGRSAAHLPPPVSGGCPAPFSPRRPAS